MCWCTGALAVVYCQTFQVQTHVRENPEQSDAVINYDIIHITYNNIVSVTRKKTENTCKKRTCSTEEGSQEYDNGFL